MGFEDNLRNIAYPLLRFTAFASHAFLFGLIPILLLVLRPAFSGLSAEGWAKGRKRLAARMEGITRACLIGSVISTSLILLLQSALVSELGEGEVGRQQLLSVLETTFGQWHALRIPLAAGLAVLLLGRIRTSALSGAGDEGQAPSTTWWGAWFVMALGLLATSTFSGHAMVASPRQLSLSNDILHLMMGSTWFAGIIVLAVVLPDAWVRKEKAERLDLLAPVVHRFSRVAFVAILLVALTGIVSSFLHIGELSDLWASSYGQALSVKLLLFGGVLALGGVNHYVVRARLERARAEGDDSESQKVFRKTIAVELVLALGLMATTGVFVGLSRTGPVELPPVQEGTAAP